MGNNKKKNQNKVNDTKPTTIPVDETPSVQEEGIVIGVNKVDGTGDEKAVKVEGVSGMTEDEGVEETLLSESMEEVFVDDVESFGKFFKNVKMVDKVEKCKSSNVPNIVNLTNALTDFEKTFNNPLLLNATVYTIEQTRLMDTFKHFLNNQPVEDIETFLDVITAFYVTFKDDGFTRIKIFRGSGSVQRDFGDIEKLHTIFTKLSSKVTRDGELKVLNLNHLVNAIESVGSKGKQELIKYFKA